MRKTCAIGIDIGGTTMRAALFDGEKILEESSLATPKDSFSHFVIMLDALIEPLEERAKKEKIKLQGIGIGIAGMLNQEKNKILKSPNLPILDNAPLAEKLSEKLKRPIKIDNDANCFVRAEAMLGACQKYNNIYGLTIGTGIGGGWWHNNKLYQGAHYAAGEPGRMIINFQERIDLEKAYQKLMQNNPGKVAREAYLGDVLAEKTFEEFGYFLGLSLANIVNLIDPEIIIIGGGVAESNDLFISQAKKAMREHIMSAKAKKIKIVKSKLGETAGVIGAALLTEL